MVRCSFPHEITRALQQAQDLAVMLEEGTLLEAHAHPELLYKPLAENFCAHRNYKLKEGVWETETFDKTWEKAFSMFSAGAYSIPWPKAGQDVRAD